MSWIDRSFPTTATPSDLVGRVLGLNPSRVGESVSCAPGRWSETPAPRFSYEWVRDRGLSDEADVEEAPSQGRSLTEFAARPQGAGASGVRAGAGMAGTGRRGGVRRKDT